MLSGLFDAVFLIVQRGAVVRPPEREAQNWNHDRSVHPAVPPLPPRVPPPPARINFHSADQLQPDATAVTEVNEFSRAGEVDPRELTPPEIEAMRPAIDSQVGSRRRCPIRWWGVCWWPPAGGSSGRGSMNALAARTPRSTRWTLPGVGRGARPRSSPWNRAITPAAPVRAPTRWWRPGCAGSWSRCVIRGCRLPVESRG